MNVTREIDETRKFVAEAKKAGGSIGFVPTMGALHIGHVSLIEAAKENTDFVVVSIFVNPTQFGPDEDFGKYPKPFEEDLQICRENGVDLVFAPEAAEMYPSGNITWVNVEKLSESLCGKARRGHFRGVATVCSKLFNIVGADIAFFGQKDAQQAIIIKRMVSDLNMALKIEVCPTVREQDGLAVSSRNRYLSETERAAAGLLYQSLQNARGLIEGGSRSTDEIKTEIQKVLGRSELLRPQYIEIVDAETLEPMDSVAGRVLIALAVHCGNTRLIDNIVVDAAGK